MFPWEPALRPGAFDQRIRRSRPDVVSFETKPLESDMVVAGTPVLTLPVTGPPDAFPITACLVEIKESGPIWNVSDGIAAVYTSTGRASIELGPVAHEFAAGAAIGLDIAFASDVRLAPVQPGKRVIDLTRATGKLTIPVVV